VHEWNIKEVPALRIVDHALWGQVQIRKQRYASHRGNRRQTKKRLLSGLIRCGRCGGGMTISKGDRYYCSARREKGTCDADRGIGVRELEERVLNGLRDILLGNEAMVAKFAAEFKKEVARLRKARTGDESRLRADLATVTRGIQRCLDFITGGEGDPGSVRDQLRALEERKRDLERQLNGRRTLINVEVHPNLPDLYRNKVENLQTLLADETARPQAVEIIRSLIERIDVHPGAERGRCEVIIVGALAHILAFTQQQTTAVPGGDDGTFLMVAGAGFEPATFRL
jgi:hypothetical protein